MAIGQSTEILRLRAMVRDLLALSTMPDAWVGREPYAIAHDLADLLIGPLELDFAFVRLCNSTGCQALEVMRGDGWKGFPEWLQRRLATLGNFSRTEIVANVGGDGRSCSGIVIPIGVNCERGIVAAASSRSSFPDQVDQQLLSVAANNAATAFQNAFLINEQLARQVEIRLEERVGERTRIARELHDTMLQSFQGLLLKLHAVLTLIPNRPNEAQQMLETLIDQAQKALAEGRDAVQGLRSDAAVSNDLAQAIQKLGAELSAQIDSNSPNFQVAVHGTPRDLAPTGRVDIYRVAGEAVRNAFQHARAARIDVEIRYDPQQLSLRIRDDGKGIDSNVLESGARAGHYGLPGLQERAELVGGKLIVRSKAGCGTEIELTIPASVVYASGSERHAFSRGKRAC